ncbi:hypothetical protein GCK32_011616 [Trichostrongylus colubriformis]|uniref:N-acetyltransferase ECO1 n=1 Tax=Trichostrongylus colubriformis TaxID=6319 RepID=A0AAN8IU25_TRICO
MTTNVMQTQKKVTDFFSSPVVKKCSLSPRTPIFELEPVTSAKKKSRLFVDEHDTKQTTLDAGQKRIGGQYCRECNMMYSIDSIVDVKMHNKHHNRLSDVAEVKVSSSQLKLWLRRECHYDSVHGPIFRIHPDSQSSLKRKMEHVIEDIVNKSVGYSPDLSIWGWDERRTVWVSILKEGSTQYIGGVIVTEPLLSARCSTTGQIIRDDDPIVGVNRLWTHPAARRKGIATEILDIIRRWVAFSDLTDDGKRFAEHYLRRDEQSNCSLLVYDVSK